MQRDIEKKMHEEKRLNEIIKEGYSHIDGLDRVHTRALKTAALIGKEDNTKKNYQLDNPEAEGMLHHIRNEEYELARILSRIPEGSNNYREKLALLQ